MKVAFIDIINDFYDKHGIYSLSSYLKMHNIDVHYIASTSVKKAMRAAAEIRPDLVLYSVFSSNLSKYIRFDAGLKELNRNITSVLGGPAATYDWNCINNTTIDALCLGEGEYAVVDYINNNFKPTKNIVPPNIPGDYKDFHPLVDLDSLPFPDRDVIYSVDSTVRDMPSKQFISGRGCPYHCTYCTNHRFNDMFSGCGKIVRKKSVEYLLDEIEMVKNKYPLTNIVFNDDTFIINRKWFFEFCEKFASKYDLTYTCNIRANLVDDDIARALHDSRCIAVNWSIESGNDSLRNDVLKRHMTKEQILQTSQCLAKFNIKHRIGNIIGLPGEKIDNIYETVELNIQAKPSIGLANIFVPFPNLELTEYAVKLDLYSDDTASLPKDYFSKSILQFTEYEHIIIKKILFLFSTFISMPMTYYNKIIRNILFKVPTVFLWALYHTTYSYKMMKLYAVKTPIVVKLKIAARYIRIM